MTQLQEFEDVLMIDTEGNVVYSAFKGVDLGTNLLEGPYRLSNLSEAYREVDEPQHRRRGRAHRLRRVQPEPGQPRGVGGDPDRRRRQVIGALAIELPIDRINKVMTADGEWEINGLGATGETYLVGRDGTMRSISRQLRRRPRRLRGGRGGRRLSPDAAALSVRNGNTLLQQR